jgi:hypothetical protein
MSDTLHYPPMTKEHMRRLMEARGNEMIIPRPLETRPMKSRRLRRYYVNESCLLDYLRSMEQWPEYVGKTVIKDIPEGATVEGVHYSFDRHCLTVVVGHESFDEVPDGEEIPQAMNGYVNVQVQFLKRQDDGKYADAALKQHTWRDRPAMV